MSKKPTRPQFSGEPLFQHIAEAPLAVMIDGIQHLADDNDFLETDIARIDDDMTAFELRIRRKGVLTALLQGTLQDWASGTMTLVRCYDGEVAKQHRSRRAWLVIISILLAIILAVSNLLTASTVDALKVAVGLLFFLGIVISIIASQDETEQQKRDDDGYLIDPTALTIDPMERLDKDKKMLLQIVEHFVTKTSEAELQPSDAAQKRKGKRS